MTRRNHGAVAAGAGALLILAAVPAQARTIEGGSGTFEDPPFESTCNSAGGQEFQIVSTAHGTYTFKVRSTPSNDYPYFGERAEIHSTYTNPVTRKFWTSSERHIEHDYKVLSVSGDVFRVRVNFSFIFNIYNPDGALDSTNRGNSAWVLDVDTKGTATIDDDEGTWIEGIRDAGRRTAGDFCADAERFTL